MNRSYLRFLVVAPILLWAACDNPAMVDPEPEEDTSTWQTIQRTILEPNCATACHVAGTTFAQQSDLILTQDVAYQQLINRTPRNEAAAADGMVLVSTEGVAGIDKSYLWEKINVPNEEHYFDDHPHYGSQMPLGGEPLTYGELSYILDWIQAGAPEADEVADRALLEDTLRYTRDFFQPLEDDPAAIKVRLGPFDVQPHFERELFYLEQIGQGEDVFIDRVEISMRPGSHHFILYSFSGNIPPNTRPSPGQYRDIRRPNGSLDREAMLPMLFHQFFAGTQWPRMSYQFPPGVGLRLPAGIQLDLNAHYVNRTDEVRQGEVHVNLNRIDEAAVAHEAKVLFLTNDDINLPPGKVTTLRRTFEVEERMHLFQLFSHAHQFMTEFRVELVGGARDGDLIYITSDWEHPPILELTPPLVLNPGDGFRLVTTYNNTTNRTLNFGLLSEDEMMILFGYYYTE